MPSDPTLLKALAPWILGDNATRGTPQSVDALLASLGSSAPLLGAGGGGWPAYFKAYGLQPSASDQAALNRFALDNPSLSLIVERLAGDLAAAKDARDAAIPRLAPADADLLLRAAVALSAGDSSSVSPQAAALLSQVDLKRLDDAALALRNEGVAARDLVPQAKAADQSYQSALGAPLRSALGARDAGAVLAALGDGAEPLHTDLSFPQIVAVSARLHGLPTAPAVPALSPDLDAPLANVMAASLLAQSQPGKASAQRLTATLAVELPHLVRAAYNLSLAPPSTLSRLSGSATPALGAHGRDHSMQTLLGGVLGPATPTLASDATFTSGAQALHAAMGSPLTDLAAAQRAESTLGPTLSHAVGALLVAQADYQRDLSPSSPVPARARAADAAAAPLLAKGTPLSSRDLQTLDDAVSAHDALRALVALRTADVLAAADALRALDGASVPMQASTPFVYRDTMIVVTGPEQDHLTLRDVPLAPILFVDLGGDDIYDVPLAGVNGTALSPGLPLDSTSTRTSVAVDLGGNDLYRAVGPMTLGAAAGAGEAPTLALLVDAAGNDQYQGGPQTLGWGFDGFGLVLDATGDDDYNETGAPLVSAGTDLVSATAAGVLVDVQGNDSYHSADGFVRLLGENASQASLAALVDYSGQDLYDTVCPKSAKDACFVTPRPDAPGFVTGTGLFADFNGKNAYPRPGDPYLPSFQQGNNNYAFTTGERTAIVQSGPPDSTGLLYDNDGDLLPNVIDSTLLNGDPDNRCKPVCSVGLTDSDGDGWPDTAETLLGTDAHNPNEYPAQLPSVQELQPGSLLPSGTPGSQAGSNMLLDLPGDVAIGLPGATTYVKDYRLIVDLGLGQAGVDQVSTESGSDVYLDNVSWNGVTVDLGGDDRYQPPMVDGSQMPGMAASTGFPAILVDLQGNDRYLGTSRSEGYATGQDSFALLLDGGGNDRYEAPAGLSQGTSVDDGSAYLIDLGGDDTYLSPNQGYAGTDVAVGSVAVFADAAGKDTYDRGTTPTTWADVDSYQGVSPVATSVPVSTKGASAQPNANTVAAFLDLAGLDTYRARDEGGAILDFSAHKNDRMIARPLQDPRGGPVTVFLDTTVVGAAGPADSDGDLSPDAAEAIAGTDSQSSGSNPVGGTVGFLLDLPNLGIGVGSQVDTRFTQDYALSVDTGGRDTYLNHAGASTPRWGVALAVDAGSDADTYASSGLTNLSAFRPLISLGAGANVDGGAVDAGYGAAQGAGILGIGILEDAGGANTFDVSVDAPTCSACTVPVMGFAASQGAGILGVGVLEVGAGGNSFHATATAHSPPDDKVVPSAVARTVSQGAGVLGIGILAVEDPLKGDSYTLDARADGATPQNVTSGQGYGLRGVGVLLDDGGNNVFHAGQMAQGAADDDEATLPLATGINLITIGWTPDQLVRKSRDSVGLLLLPGAGDDTLDAASRSQAYAGFGGLAALVDANGDDVRTLTPDDGTPSMGQAAARANGIAILLDNRGDDRYISRAQHAPDDAQAFSDQGVALLVDASGSDTYSATDQAQGMIAPNPVLVNGLATPATALLPSDAFFVDRMGVDSYQMGYGNLGQGGVRAPSAPTTKEGVGVALFLDLGGMDAYAAALRGQTPLSEKQGSTVVVGPTSRPSDGNDWRWTSASGTNGEYQGLGVDDESVGDGVAALTSALSTTVGVGAEVAVKDPDTGANAPSPLHGNVQLVGHLGNGGSALKSSAQGVDRVEFRLDSLPLGRATIPSGDDFKLAWKSNATDINGDPRYADGERTLHAYVYLRAGTPAAADSTGRQQAVDAEPIPTEAQVLIDNPPVPRVPAIPSVLSTSRGEIEIPLRVDRDLETHTQCPACDPASVAAGPDDWAPAPTVDLLGDARGEAFCLAEDCAPTGVTAVLAQGKVYLNWTAPAEDLSSVKLYRVFRNDSGEARLIGSVDARAPQMRFLDATPGPQYRVEAVRERPVSAGSNALPWTITESPWTNAAAPDLPGPVTGLRAFGAEGAIRLAWRPAPGAEGYVVLRNLTEDASTFGAVGSPLGPDATTFLDQVDGAGTMSDVRYTYQVVATDSLGSRSLLPSLPVSALAAPGEKVTLTLQGATADYGIVDNLSLGGAQVGAIRWATPSQVPDGSYLLTTRLEDARHAVAQTQTPVLLDGTPPVTSIGLPALVGNARQVAGGLSVPLTIKESGSGLAAVALYAQVGDGPWKTVGPISPSQFRFDGTAYVGDAVVPGIIDGQTVRLIAAAQDVAGNVEGLTRAVPWTPDVTDGLDDLLAAGAATTVRTDFQVPSGSASPMLVFVRPNATVHLEMTAKDVGSGVASVVADMGIATVHLAPHGSAWGGNFVAHDTCQCPVNFIVQDQAGNTAKVPGGIIVVDNKAPNLTAAQVSFPGGRAVGLPGDIATVLLSVVDENDNRIPQGGINVTLDARAFSSAGSVSATYDESLGSYRAQFIVDRAPAANATLVARLTDPAGNAASYPINLTVNATGVPFSSPVAVSPGRTSARFTWTTQDTARGRIEYGAGDQLGATADEPADATQHDITITGLVPSTNYTFRAIVVSAAGVQTVSDVSTFETLPGMNVTLGRASYLSNGALVVPVHVDTFGAEGQPAIELTLVPPRGSPTVIAGAHGVDAAPTLDLTSFRDGEYRLFATASMSGLAGQSATSRLVLDRTPPLVSLNSSQVLVAGKLLSFQAVERGSGIDILNATVTVGGNDCLPFLQGDTVSCRVPALPSDDFAAVAVHVPDLAGNAQDFEVRLPVDSVAPALANATLVGDGGTDVIRPGGQATIGVDASDLTLRSVVVDLTPLGGSAAEPMLPVGGHHYQATLSIPPTLPLGSLAFVIRATDGANGTSQATVLASVDALAPSVVGTETVTANQEPGAAVLQVAASEPVRIEAQARGAEGPIWLNVSGFSSRLSLPLTGLRPGAPTDVALTLVDRAGWRTVAVASVVAAADTQAPDMPLGLRVEDQGDGRLVVAWTPASDDFGVESYRVVRTVAGQAPVLQTAQDARLLDKAPVGVAVQYAVSAVDYAGNEGPKAEVQVVPAPVPHLSGGAVTPPLGGPGLFVFTVNVTDVSAQPPDVEVVVDSVAHAMHTDAKDCRAGCVYTAEVSVGAETLTSGAHHYAFRASHGTLHVSWPEGDALAGPDVVASLAPSVGALRGIARAPGLTVSAVLITLVLVGAAGTYLLRRNRR